MEHRKLGSWQGNLSLNIPIFEACFLLFSWTVKHGVKATAPHSPRVQTVRQPHSLPRIPLSAELGENITGQLCRAQAALNITII